jgi:hypothetical protein
LCPDELKTSGLAHATERLGRHQRHVVTPLPEGAADANKWVNIAARPDWRQEKVRHASSYFPEECLSGFEDLGIWGFEDLRS